MPRSTENTQLLSDVERKKIKDNSHLFGRNYPT